VRSTSRQDRSAVLGLVLCVVLAGCSSASGGSANSDLTTLGTAAPPLVKPEIESFAADPTSIVTGGTSTLSWTVNDPSARISMRPFDGEPEGNSVTVAPIATTTYTLTIRNAAGTDTASVTVIVTESGVTPTGGSTDTTAVQGAWTPVTANLAGMPSECGNLGYVSAKPDGVGVIATVATHGLFNLNLNGNWDPLGTGPGSAEITNRTRTIVYDPERPTTFWQSGTYHDGGVFRTDDGGTTFRQLGNISHIDLVSIDFNDPQRQTLLAGMHEHTTLYLSRDGGDSWQDITKFLPEEIGYTGYPLVLSHDVFLLGSEQGTASGIYSSTDGGVTWTQRFNESVIGQPLVHNQIIFWSLQGGRGMVRSIDGGQTWQPTGVGPGSLRSDTIIDMGDGRIAAIGEGWVVVSADEGETWARYGPRLTIDATGLAYTTVSKQLYVWRWDCGGDESVKPDSIVRLDPG
jgi:photosystem II stability/assembly factor-like uncharacterized protein